MPKGKSSKTQTFALLKKALTGKTLQSRKKAWATAQQRLKIKKGPVLKKFVEGVEKGDKKHATGLIAAVIGEKNRNFDPQLDVRKGIKQKTQKSDKEISRFAKNPKRKREKDVSEGKKISRLTDPTSDDFKVVSSKGSNFGISPQIMQLVLNGDIDGMAQKLGTLEAKEMFDSKLRNVPLKSEQYTLVKDFLLDSTRLMKRILSISTASSEMQRELDVINKYRNDYEKGLRPDVGAVNESVAKLMRMVQEKQTSVMNQEKVDLSGILTKFEKDSAESILNERILREEFEAQKEAQKAYEEQAIMAEEEAKKSEKLFAELKQRQDINSTVSSFINDEKIKANIEPQLNEEAQKFANENNKKHMYNRLATMTNTSKETVSEQLRSGLYGKRQREFEEAVIMGVTEAIKRRVLDTNSSYKKITEKIIQLSKDLPVINEFSAKILKDRVEVLPDQIKEEREVSSLQSQIKEIKEEQNKAEDALYNAKEDKEALMKVIGKTAKKRVLGEEDANTALYRSKIRATEDIMSFSEKKIKSLNEELKDKEAKVTAIQLNRSTINKEAENTKNLQENSNALSDLLRQNNESVNLLNQENYVEVETIALGGEMVKNNNVIGNRTINLEFTEENSKIRSANVFTPPTSKYQTKRNEIIASIDNVNEQIETLKVIGGNVKYQLVQTGMKLPDVEKSLAPYYQEWYALYDKKVKLQQELQALDKKEEIDQSQSAVELYDWKKAPLWKYENQSKVIVPSSIDVAPAPSFEKLKLELQSATKRSKTTGYNLTGGSMETFKPSKKQKVESGLYLTGNRPDPFLNLQFWKNLYNKSK